MPRPERCCRWVETRKYAMTCSIDQTAYHRLPRGRSEVQSNFVAVSMLHQRTENGGSAAHKARACGFKVMAHGELPPAAIRPHEAAVGLLCAAIPALARSWPTALDPFVRRRAHCRQNGKWLAHQTAGGQSQLICTDACTNHSQQFGV